jgi:hypothetical protein
MSAQRWCGGQQEVETLRKALIEGLIDEIAAGIVLELESRETEAEAGPASAVDRLAEQIAQEVARRLGAGGPGAGPGDGQAQLRPYQAEGGPEQLHGEGNVPVESKEAASFPNLKYAKPKYQNIESLLNYMESKESQGGLKLVIMNFND